ncbi:serine hydrolase [bacterium]
MKTDKIREPVCTFSLIFRLLVFAALIQISAQQAAWAAGSGHSTELERQVEAYIKNLRRKGVVKSDEKTAWSVYDFTSGEKLVDINEERQMQAASLIKPYIALAFFHEVKRKRFIYGPKSRNKMEAMIRNSDNKATNWVIKTIGGPARVQRILSRNYGGIFRKTSIVEYIPRNGGTYKNKSSAHDYSRFLYALWKGNLPYSDEIKRIMSLSGRDRLVDGVKEIPSGTLVVNKTGSTSMLCGDMGIISVMGRDGKRYAYTFIGIIEKRKKTGNYSNWISARANVIRGVSKTVYLYMKKRHSAL